MGRKPCCTKEGVNRGAWSDQEDKILITYIKNHGEGKWRGLPERAGLSRCGKSCRLRWLNYLRPDIKRGNISPEEEDLIIRLHKLLGNRWSLIAGRLPGRTDNEIKNYWNTCLSKKMKEAQTSKPPIQEQNSESQEKRSSLETSVEEEPSSELETNQVIRTKATRCTKVSLPPQEDDQMNEKDIVPGPEDDDSMNFLLDYDMGQIVGSNAPGSGHVRAFGEETREKNGSISEDDGRHIFSSWFDDRYSFGEAAFDEWRKSDYIQNDMPFELEMWNLP